MKLMKHPRLMPTEPDKTDSSDIGKPEKCVSKRFQSTDLEKYPNLIILKWGTCDSSND